MLKNPCPYCGSFNEESAPVCYFCKKALSGASPKRYVPHPSSRPAIPPEDRIPDYRRPGCVTLYAIIIFLSGVFGIGLALFLPSAFSNDTFWQSEAWREVGAFYPDAIAAFRSQLLFSIIFLFLYSVLMLLMGWGLWTMRNWARILLLIVQGISLLSGLAVLFYSIAVSQGSLFVCIVNSASLIIPAWIFLWFLFNRRLFR